MDQPQDPTLSSNIISVSTHLYKRGCPSVGLLVRWLRVFYMVENSQTMYDWFLTDHQTSTPLSSSQLTSYFFASSSYRKYFSADNIWRIEDFICNKKNELPQIFVYNFIDRRNFKAAENSSSSLAAEATEVSIRVSDVPEKEYLKYISQTSKQAPENISPN